MENVYFDNHDSLLHQTIKMNNEALTIELLKHNYDVNASGEVGTPLITAIHFDIYWAIELLLKHGADLTVRHIDWPYWTIYQYCVQFAKIESKLLIEKHYVNVMKLSRHSSISC